jgi:hypothetical protein
VPPPQVSPVVQAFPSSHGSVLLTKTQPDPGLHESLVHPLLSSQITGAPGWQLPPPQVSPNVQALPSSQALVLFVKTQPELGLQVSVVQPFPSLHTSGVPGWQLPPPHVSPVVHALPSLHEAVLLTYEQPVAGMHESSVQALLSLQTTGVPGRQLPPPHVSPVVQALPSSHDAVLLA